MKYARKKFSCLHNKTNGSLNVTEKSRNLFFLGKLHKVNLVASNTELK